MSEKQSIPGSVLKTGFYASVLLAFLTLVTFDVAMTAVPKSGPFCTGDCIAYPYHDSLRFFPGDYYWMVLSMGQLCVWLVWTVALFYASPEEKRIFSLSGLLFAVMASVILLADYFLQVAVVPVSLMKGETDGIAMLTQYNDHGIFIALEELGYILMSISLFCMGLAFSRSGTLERSLRRLLLAPFLLTLVALAAVIVRFGIDRSYRFEVPAITFNWLVLIIAGIMTAINFHRQGRNYVH